jgi:hypothetical protein
MARQLYGHRATADRLLSRALRNLRRQLVRTAALRGVDLSAVVAPEPRDGVQDIHKAPVVERVEG